MLGDGMWQRGMRRFGVANEGTMGGGKRRARAQWDWEASCSGVVNHGPTMGSLAPGSRDNALNSGTSVGCSQG